MSNLKLSFGGLLNNEGLVGANEHLNFVSEFLIIKRKPGTS